MCEQVDECIRPIVCERSEAARWGRFGPVISSRVATELALVMEQVGERE